jgi:hypothetical protein
MSKKDKKLNAGLKCLNEIKKLQALVDASDCIKLHRAMKAVYISYQGILSLVDHESFGPKKKVQAGRKQTSFYKRANA